MGIGQVTPSFKMTSTNTMSSNFFLKSKLDHPQITKIQINFWTANPEIVSLIFGFLDASTLPALARTARMFTEPALNWLWQVQQDLVPLLQCFPRDLWSRSAIAKKGVSGAWEVLSFRRPLSEGDWPRFDFYARRIRRLEGVHLIRNQRRCDVHQNTIAELSAYRPARTLFPKLHILVFTQSWLTDLAATPFSQILLGSSLTETSIVVSDIPEHGGQSYSSLELLCGSLQRLCPNIKSLSFHNLEKAPVRAMPAVYQLVCSQKHLHTLCFRSATPSEELVSHLAKLPDLHTLVFVRIPPSHLHFYTTRHAQFPRLHTFVFEIPNWIQAAMVMSTLQCPFQSLSIRTLDTEPVSALATFVDSLMWHPSLTTLAYVNITTHRLHLSSPLGGPLVLHALQTLFSCSALQQLQLHSPVFQDLDDTWLEGAAKAWPGLTKLFITVAPMQGSSRMTLQGIVPLVKACPLLNTLRLPIHAAPVDWKLLDGVRNHLVTKLVLEHSTIVQPGQVFRTLIAMFPNLGGVEHLHAQKDDGLHGQPYMAWRSVNELLLATATAGSA